VARDIVEVIVQLFYVLAVVALTVAEAEEALFENGVFAIPEGYAKAKVLEEIRYACQAIFAPAVHTAMGMVEREVMPGIAIGAIIFAYGAPLALAQVRAPLY
jgi:hypothetical protein